MHSLSASGIPRCPTCHQIDAVRKVSAIVADGTRITHSSGTASVPMPYNPDDPASIFPGTARYDSTHVDTSFLALRLARPIAPSPPSPPVVPLQRWSGPGFAAASLLFGALFCLPLPFYQVRQGLWPLGCLAFPFVWYLVSVRLSRQRRPSKTDVADYQARLTTYETEHRAWQRRVALWERAFYCYRCDADFAG